MKKQLVALSAAVLITACVGLAMLAIGGAALFNKNGVTAANSSTDASAVAQVSVQQQQQDAAQIQQLQSLVAQYQSREQQYQQREQQYQSQLNQANAQVQQLQAQMQQVQALLIALQQRGLIAVTSDGRIMIMQ